MAFCKHRVMDKCKKDNRPCIFSKECCEPEEKKMTNADRIRNMADEELYKFLRFFGVCRICKHRKDEGCDNRGCTQEEVDVFFKEWLQAEVKEGNSDENT